MDMRQDKVDAEAAIAERARGCTACGLSAGRSHVVFGVGNVNSPLMLVGEGPGMNEDATGIPFVGRAGQLLDECLRDAGMLRKHVYVTNVVKCRATLIEGGRVQNRAPTPEEIGVCAPLWLHQQITIVQPAVIVCIGGPSANTLIHPGFRMIQERGKWFETKYCRHTMAVLHPAFILRKEGDDYASARQSLVDDLAAARDRAKAAKSEPKLSLF